MVHLQRQYNSIKQPIDLAIRSVVEKSDFIMGRAVADFESKLCDYLKVKYAIGCASGTDALQIALMASGIGDGDEVITSPFSFMATTETILLLGAKPIFVDIDSQTYNLDVSQISKQITSKTKAILPVHLYGHPADMKPILSLARAEGLFVIEDTAQAIGAQYFGAFAGTLGNLGCFSFFPSKNLGAFGDAGAIVTNDPKLAEQCKMIRLHGSRTKYRHEILGVNSRLDTIQAAVLNAKLPYLEGWLQKRIAIAKTYNKGFERLPLTTPFCSSNIRHVYHQYSLCTSRRDELATFLKENGVGSAIHYPVPLHRQGAYDKVKDLRTKLPNSERIASEIISLPMFPELTESEIARIISVVCKFYSS